MKMLFLLAIIITQIESVKAEVWRCKQEDTLVVYYTDTPTSEDGLQCKKVAAVSFTRASNTEIGVQLLQNKAHARKSQPGATSKVKGGSKRLATKRDKIKENGGRTKKSSRLGESVLRR